MKIAELLTYPPPMDKESSVASDQSRSVGLKDGLKCDSLRCKQEIEEKIRALQIAILKTPILSYKVLQENISDVLTQICRGTRKITRTLADIISGKKDRLVLGNLDAKRDWGHAKDYVESMWKILQNKKADDFVIATKTSKSVKDFINICAKKLDINLTWKFKGLKEIAIDSNTKKTIIKVDKKYFRETEVDNLSGDYKKAKKILKWKKKYSFDNLVEDMIKNEI